MQVSNYGILLCTDSIQLINGTVQIGYPDVLPRDDSTLISYRVGQACQCDILLSNGIAQVCNGGILLSYGLA